MNKVNLLFEILWLVTGLISLGMGIHASITAGFEKSYIFFIIAFFAAIIYLVRRKLRRTSRNEKTGK